MQIFAAGQRKTQLVSMQLIAPLPRQPFFQGQPPWQVEGISQQRRSQGCAMDADLMGPSRGDLDLDDGEACLEIQAALLDSDAYTLPPPHTEKLI